MGANFPLSVASPGLSADLSDLLNNSFGVLQAHKLAAEDE